MKLAAAVALLAVCVAFILANPAAQAQTGDPPGESAGYELIYSAENPVPQIAASARPAVVQVISKVNKSQEISYGSGVYVDSRGYILTNSHVVEGADAVDIQLLDGTRIPVVEFHADSGTDIAILQIAEPLDVAPVPLGNSDALVVGELAIAIGNPGVNAAVFYGTVTVGVISGLDRNDFSGTSFQRAVSVIQTDAAINYGNSGGALLNRRGELVGMPTLKIASDWFRAYEGLGFAIPINTIKPVMYSLIEYGMVRRPRLGVEVSVQDGPDTAMRRYPPAGIKIESILEGSPAEQAGIRRYDIITKVDGIRVRTLLELSGELDSHMEGDQVTLTIHRYFDEATGDRLSTPEAVEITATLRIVEEGEGTEG